MMESEALVANIAKIEKSVSIWPQAMIALSFGRRSDGPGQSNEAIAMIVKNLYERYRFPLILQEEIADFLPSFPIFKIIREHRKSGKYLDTLEVIAQTIEVCRINYWQKAIIICHSGHAWMARKIAEELGFLVEIADNTTVPYDKHSIQWWTRNKYLFYFREIPTRIYSLIRGWI